VGGFVYHFSEDPSIDRFTPHVPRSNPTQAPAVWAIDEDHAPLYWFPRDCPRVTAWTRDATERAAFHSAFCTTADRVHAIEVGWLKAMQTTTLYRYILDASFFRPWPPASGQWISESIIDPVGMDSVGPLIERHAGADIELRIVPSLWPVHALAVSGRWDFSIVRMSNARPAAPPGSS
jgi:hypothetical protein